VEGKVERVIRLFELAELVKAERLGVGVRGGAFQANIGLDGESRAVAANQAQNGLYPT